jgi:RNA-binding protein 5/10
MEVEPALTTTRKILTGLDYVSGDLRLSTDQIKSVRIRTNRRGLLRNHHPDGQSSRLISLGSRIAFVDFYRLSDATRFYDDFYPEVPLPLQHTGGAASEPVIVTIDYSRPREDSDRHQGRTEDRGWDCTNVSFPPCLPNLSPPCTNISKCGGVNYPHRAVCYKCKADRPGKSRNLHTSIFAFSLSNC